MKINQSCRSPNFTSTVIPVEFVVLHYTACDLPATLEVFSDPAHQASSHFVVDTDGAVYETVPCSNGSPLRAWHAGKSRWDTGGKLWEAFNDFSIGIELVNNNGNIIDYPAAQYHALVQLIRLLQSLYPALKDFQRVIGHEQIAGWRGKIDPGWRFDWTQLAECFPGQSIPERKPALPADLRDCLERLAASHPEPHAAQQKFWQALNLTLEKAAALIQESRTHK